MEEAEKPQHGTKEFYQTIGSKGGKSTSKLYGKSHYEKIGKEAGKKGGNVTKERYGMKFYERIGKKGGAQVKAAFEALREKNEKSI